MAWVTAGGMIYTFKVSLGKVYRVIEIRGSDSLYNLADAIIDAFGFDLDHAFGFYDNAKIYNSVEVYELFADMPEDEVIDRDENVKGVRNTSIDTVFVEKKTMTFLFDYGDDWTFKVACTKIAGVKERDIYPRVVKSVGEAPEQYPSYDEEDEDESCEVCVQPIDH